MVDQDTDTRWREVAAYFLQAQRASVFQLLHRLYPQDQAAAFAEATERIVETEGQYADAVQIVRDWFRTEDDVRWLERFWQSEEGRRFIDLLAALNFEFMRREAELLFKEIERLKKLLPPDEA